MKNLSTAFLFVILTTSPAIAQDVENCDPYPDVPINITPVFDEPKYDFSQNLAQIQLIASDRIHSIPQYHAVTMGITRYEPVLEFHVPMIVRTEEGGMSGCAFVKHVDVNVGYRNVTVFIASEIPEGTCAFDETMAHEQKHIGVNRQTLAEFVPLIEDRFKAYLRLNGVQQVENADYAQKIITDKLKSIMEDVTGQMQAENIARQREVDSIQEYTRLSQVCQGELTKIANRYRRIGP